MIVCQVYFFNQIIAYDNGSFLNITVIVLYSIQQMVIYESFQQILYVRSSNVVINWLCQQFNRR